MRYVECVIEAFRPCDLGSGSSLLCDTYAIEDGMEGYAMSCQILAFLNLKMSTTTVMCVVLQFSTFVE